MDKICIRKIINEQPLIIIDDLGNEVNTGCMELLCYIGRNRKPETMIANKIEYKTIKEKGYFIVND